MNVRNNCLKSNMSKFYNLSPKQLGSEVTGIDLKTENRKEVIEQIKKDVIEHKLLIFQNQGIISGDRHVEISKWFGELESTFYKHPKSPHPDVFRVSNDKSEGCTGVGRTGWHIDGSFQHKPFSHSLYHMVSVPKKGATSFIPLTQLINRLDDGKRKLWDRLWMRSDRRTGPIHPLIYSHPTTKDPVLCFHLGMTEGFIIDNKSPNQRILGDKECSSILEDIHSEIVYKNKDLMYTHKWKEGEFIISDNLAVGHEATPETQYDREEVGLRVLHRTTIGGTTSPSK